MPWYALTSLDITGLPTKREVLYRDSIAKVWLFVSGRAVGHRIPDGVFGYFISEAESDETWDFDIDEPRSQNAIHAVEVPIVHGERQR